MRGDEDENIGGGGLKAKNGGELTAEKAQNVLDVIRRGERQ